MESPQTSKQIIQEAGDTSLFKVNCTPKTPKCALVCGGEFSLYHVHRESSPSFRGGQDMLEIGWGDSPEPLNLEQKFDLNKTPVACRKKLEPRESPKSSIPFKRRNFQSTCSLPSKSIIDVAKYVAEVQELSKNIMKEFNTQKIDKNILEDEKLPINSTQLVETNLNLDRLSPVQKTLENSSTNSKDSECAVRNNDSAFDSVLQTFINEEDDWLSQALSSQEVTKTPHKGSFVKSKSENELSLTQSVNFERKSLTQNCRNINNNLRKTSSFDMTKPYINSKSCLNNLNKTESSFNGGSNGNINQYSLQEIERKRLEAKYRKERREIERKKLEALRKLEMKKLRVIKT